VHKHVSLLGDPSGRSSHFIVLATDITAQRAYQEKIETLMREVNHRSKNMLALVHAVAKQTASAGADDFLERFGDRVQALAASQDLLVQTDWEGADLAALIESQLLHFKDLVGERIMLGGPKVELAPRAAQTLGMALHELATNAAKYGALSNGNGSVEICWQLTQGEEEPHLAIEWTEKDGPPVVAPKRLGFGRRVAKTLVESALGAQVTLDYAETGVRWTLRCPLSSIEMSGSAPVEATIPPAGQASLPIRAPATSAVLIVEDDAVLALELAEDLQAAGFDIIGPAASIAQAVDLLQQREPAFAILDVNLGGETSEPIAQRLQEKNIPFVSVSGYLRSQQPAIFQDGPFLSKPVHMPSLLKEIERANITAAR
jgi:two-component sensor histidine kinase/CheY-like chemotaxis protein